MIVFADEYDILNLDIDYLEEELAADEEELLDQDAEEEMQTSSELFSDSGSGSTDRESGLDQIGTHISVKVDGYPVTLTDVPRDAWFAPYVRDVADRGIVSGYRGQDGLPLGLFGPADNVTIEQLAKMAIEASGTNPDECSGDVKNETAVDSWSEQYILCAEEKGWAVFSDGSVTVQRNASRAEVVVTVLQAFGVKLRAREGGIFDDVDSSTEFAAAVETAAGDSIVSGYKSDEGVPTGEFGPTDPVNRAEVAKIIALAIQVYGSL